MKFCRNGKDAAYMYRKQVESCAPVENTLFP